MTTPAERRGRGLVYILVATGIAGACGYLIQLLAPALLTDPGSYVTFSVFWSTLYLFVGAVAGVQQEVTRAVSPTDRPAATSTLRRFTVLAAGMTVVVSVVVGIVLAPSILSADPIALTIWFGVGLLGYLGCAVLSGVMYGLALWGPIAAVTVVDATVRAILVTAGLALHLSSVLLAAFTAVPFLVAFVVVWFAVRRRVVGRFALDVGPGRLAVNALRTVTAAAATGAVVTGLPLLIHLTMPDAPATVIASLIAVITITRAPLIVPIMALQSFLIVDFRAVGTSIWPRLARYLAIVVGATVVACVAASVLGPWLIAYISDGRYEVTAVASAVIVASAGLVGMLSLTGSALLSANRHSIYVGGWLAAAGATVVAFVLPIDPVTRTLVALCVGPLIGLVVHLLGVRADSIERSPSDAADD